MIQHTDRIITSKAYAPDKIKITTIFRTLQGEAPYTGYPAVFVRLSGCNFGNKHPNSYCNFCDTNFQFDNGIDYCVDDLCNKIDEYARLGDIVVLTGGEPTLQPALPSLIDQLSKNPKFSAIQIETNGTQSKFFANVNSECCIVCSPKGNYKVGYAPKISDTAIRRIDVFKFLLEDVEGSPHHVVPEWIFNSGKSIYVSPIAVYARSYDGEVSSIWEPGLIDFDQTSKNYRYAAQYALEHNIKLSIQQHLFASLP